MSGFEKIDGAEIEKYSAIHESNYLCGDLKLPQELAHLHDENVEIGLCYYKDFSAKKAHYHTEVTEYQYVLCGEVKYLDIANNTEHTYRKGDFYIIRPNTHYIEKVSPDSKVFFIKSPGKNDKISVEESLEVREWASSWE